MNTNGSRETAKIYQFHSKAQLAAMEGRRALFAAPARVEAPAVDFSSWYHQAAVEDSQRGRK